MKQALVVAGGIALALICLGLLFFGVRIFQKETADFRGSVSQTEKVLANGDYRIAAYDDFFNKCSAIQSTEDQIAIQELELASATPERQHFIRINVTALESKRAELIRQYNADASKTETRGNFLASNLPYSIDIKGTTQCAA